MLLLICLPVRAEFAKQWQGSRQWAGPEAWANPLYDWSVVDGKTIMRHGDQHMGLVVRHDIDDHNDGPYAFMVPGTRHGYPRAWWPNGPEGEVVGDYIDPFGNKFSVLAAANPEPGTNTLTTREEGDPEHSAHVKGSGYGLVVVDPETHQVTFNMYRYLFDADKPEPDDQFADFPVTIQSK